MKMEEKEPLNQNDLIIKNVKRRGNLITVIDFISLLCETVEDISNGENKFQMAIEISKDVLETSLSFGFISKEKYREIEDFIEQSEDFGNTINSVVRIAKESELIQKVYKKNRRFLCCLGK